MKGTEKLKSLISDWKL